jgi:flagellar biosynthesis repressor protein FlbT
MSLKLNLAAGESLLVGKARITNGGDKRCVLIVAGEEAILRESLLMLEKDATTPTKRLYFVVQGIYLSDQKEDLFPLYHEVARAAVAAYPLLTLPVTDVSQLILGGRYYDALNRAHALIEMEAKILDGSPKETE